MNEIDIVDTLVHRNVGQVCSLSPLFVLDSFSIYIYNLCPVVTLDATTQTCLARRSIL